MKFDVIVIGGGLAGLTSAIRSAEAGLKTVVVSHGESALTFASGSIDVLGMNVQRQLIQDPFAAMAALPENHPYQKLGAETVQQSLRFFRAQMDQAGMHMSHEAHNSGRLTAIGAIRPTWLSQSSQKTLPLDNPAQNIKRIAVINIASLRDFQPPLVAAGLKKHPAFVDTTVIQGNIHSETLNIQARNVHELRSIELARTLKRDLFSQSNGLHILASALQKAAKNADLVVIPSVLAVANGNEIIRQLENATGLRICEVATLPPSLPGMRMAAGLKQRFRELGGLFIEGDEVIGGEFATDELNGNVSLQVITTKLNPSTPLRAQHFVIATGRFFSCGLSSDRHTIVDPVFGLDLLKSDDRAEWSQDQFLAQPAHGFQTYGLDCNQQFQPSKQGQTVHNLYGAGAVIGGFNPVQEASAGGVSISTAWFAAQQIILAQQAPSVAMSQSEAVIPC